MMMLAAAERPGWNEIYSIRPLAVLGCLLVLAVAAGAGRILNPTDCGRRSARVKVLSRLSLSVCVSSFPTRNSRLVCLCYLGSIAIITILHELMGAVVVVRQRCLPCLLASSLGRFALLFRSYVVSSPRPTNVKQRQPEHVRSAVRCDFWIASIFVGSRR